MSRSHKDNFGPDTQLETSNVCKSTQESIKFTGVEEQVIFLRFLLNRNYSN